MITTPPPFNNPKGAQGIRERENPPYNSPPTNPRFILRRSHNFLLFHTLTTSAIVLERSKISF